MIQLPQTAVGFSIERPGPVQYSATGLDNSEQVAARVERYQDKMWIGNPSRRGCGLLLAVDRDWVTVAHWPILTRWAWWAIRRDLRIRRLPRAVEA